MTWQTPPAWSSDTPISQTNLNTLSGDLNYLKNSAIFLNAPTIETPNGSQTTFSINNPAVASFSVAVYKNGLRKRLGVEFTFVSGNNYVTFTTAPYTGDSISFDYIPS